MGNRTKDEHLLGTSYCTVNPSKALLKERV